MIREGVDGVELDPKLTARAIAVKIADRLGADDREIEIDITAVVADRRRVFSLEVVDALAATRAIA